jgi:hypothetical protein
MITIKKSELFELLGDQLKLRKILLLFGSSLDECQLLTAIYKILKRK